MPAEEIRERERLPHFADYVGIEILDEGPDEPRARVEVRDELRQPFGLMHGGVMLTMVESVCSRATTLAVLDEGMAAMGQSLSLSFLRPISEGYAEVRARPRHRGRTTWVWDAEIRDSAERVCAIAQMTVAVRSVPSAT
jgi:1,4-dihydroxy-2-naphthoyl-CoA hydrolase